MSTSRSPPLRGSRFSLDTVTDEKQVAQAQFEQPDGDNDTIVEPAASTQAAQQQQQQRSTRNRPTLSEMLPHFWAMPHLFTKHTFVWIFATTFVMIVYIWLYLGALWQPLSRVRNVDILFYNGDAGFDYSNTPAQIQQLTIGITKNQTLGEMVQAKIMDPNGALNHVVRWNDWSDRKGLTREELVDQVEKGEFWGLLYVPSNFSNNYLSFAPSNTGPATQPKVIDMEYIFDQGRGYGTHSLIEKFVSRSLDAFGRAFETSLLTSPVNTTLLATMHPMFWVNTLHYTETVLHPVKVYGANFASYVTFIVLYIGAMLTVYSIAKFLPNTIETLGILGLEVVDETGTTTPNRPFSKFPALQIAIARYFLALLFSLMHTIFVWMVPQILDGHQNEGGNAGQIFFFIWFTSWSFVSILSFLCQLLTADGFQGPATMLMILMFTSSSGILDWSVMPGFFRIGYAFPFSYGVRGLRYFYFGSQQNNMWINWLVILGWIVVPGIATMLMARTNIRIRRQQLRDTYSSQQV
ncbi:hypothetical protein BGZ73_001267 [Actinomortierella ambigua]|nr:hypothetical protein BGZ73_001267 [Actinomortierella ambigua]